MKVKKYVLAITGENDNKIVDEILKDFNVDNEDYVIINVNKKQLLSKFHLFNLKLGEKISSIAYVGAFFRNIKHFFDRKKLNRSIKSFSRVHNPLDVKEGNGRGVKRLKNAISRFAPHYVMVFDSVMSKKMAYLKRKFNLNLKVSYIEASGVIGASNVLFNIDSYAVMNGSVKEMLVNNSYPEEQVKVLACNELFKQERDINTSLDAYAYVLVKLNGLNKIIADRLISLISTKYKDVHIILNTGYDLKLTKRYESMDIIKNSPNITIEADYQEALKKCDYVLMNADYSNYLEAINNDVVPIVYKTSKYYENRNYKYFKEKNIAFCIDNKMSLASSIDEMFKNQEKEMIIRKNIKAEKELKIEDINAYIDTMARKLEKEQGEITISE